MANNKEIHVIRGRLHWAKVLGDPVDNYGKDGKEWVFDLSLDEDGVKQIKGIKVNGKPALTIKDKDDDRGKFVTLKQKFRELRPDPRTGEKRFSKAPKVMDAAGKPWNPDDKLGNGTVADVKFEVVDYGKSMYAGVYPQAIRVLEHQAYNAQEFAPLSPDDEYFAEPVVAERHLPDANDDLDDDVPY